MHNVQNNFIGHYLISTRACKVRPRSLVLRWLLRNAHRLQVVVPLSSRICVKRELVAPLSNKFIVLYQPRDVMPAGTTRHTV